MKNYVIVTDSCSDLDTELRRDNDIEYIKMIMTRDGVESYVDLDWKEFSPKQFYDNMRNGALYRTTQINVAMYINGFEEYLKQGMDILSLCTSSGLSGSVNSARLAKDALAESYPDRKIICVDTLRGSMGQGLLVLTAAEMRKQGKSIEEVAAWIDDNKLSCHQIGTVDDMKYLKRAGRVTGTAALMCGIFNIKPIIISNTKGQNETVSKVRGRKTSIRTCAEYIADTVIDPQNQTLYIVHADCIEEAQDFKAEILKLAAFKDVYLSYVGPMIGATVGPGMLGAYYYGKKAL